MSAENDCTSKGMEAAVRSLKKSLGGDVEVFSQEAAIVPETDRRLVRVTAAAAGEANKTAQVVVDDDGTVVDLGALEMSIGRPVFVPDIGEITAAAPKPGRVTIDPTSNDFSLECCQEWTETITVGIPVSGAIPMADVYLLADTTGSMDSVIAAVQAGIGAIVTSPALSGFDVAYGVGNYKDFPGSPSVCFQHQLSPTTIKANVSGAVATWAASGGGDTAEGQFFALHRLAAGSIGWRPGARRIVVWFGDAPGHDPICPAISGESSPITEASLTAELVAANITVVAISVTTGVPGGLDADPVPHSFLYAVCGAPGGVAGQATRIAAATGGSHTTGVNAGTIAATVIALIEAAVTKTGNVSLVPSASIAGFITSITPAGGYGPLAGDVAHSLGFEVRWKGTVMCTDKPQVFRGSIDVVADKIVVARKSVRITVPACRYHHTVEFLCGTSAHEGCEGCERCDTVVPGRYATAVTIYNPTACAVEIEKRFAPLLLRGEALGREPRTMAAKTYDRITLGPGEATMDDCCNIDKAFGSCGEIVLGVLDVVASAPVEVIAVMTAAGHEKSRATSVHTRHVSARRDCCTGGCCK